MRVLELSRAPNPKRLRVFLDEKGIELERVEVDPASDAHRNAPYYDAASSGHFPILEFDDGTHLAESMAICRFLERLHPDPPLFGRNPREGAEIEMWNRRVELGLFRHTADFFGHTAPFFKDRIEQIPAFAASARKSALGQLVRIDRALSNRRFVAGDGLSVADITLFVAVDLGVPSVFELGGETPCLTRWFESLAERPAFGALLRA